MTPSATRRHQLRPLSAAAVVRLGLLVVALGVLGYGLTASTLLPLLAALVLGFAGASYLGVFAPPSWLFSLGIAGTVFSGNADRIGLPIGPDRLFIAAALASLALGLPGARSERAIMWRPLHAVLAATAAMGVISAVAAGTFLTDSGFFSLLDRLGLVPFIAFTLAPLVYGSTRDRNALLVVLVGTGAYLGLTALLEGTDNRALVWPRYIADESVGSHFGRARGPFAEAVGNGMALYGCAVASALAAYTWQTVRSRRFAGLVAVICLTGTIFTLTRAIWLATAVATLMALLTTQRTRRALLPVGLAATAVLVAALTFVPGFADRVTERSSSQNPLWDRFNTNRAALAMVRERPLTGVGWDTFEEKAPDYMRLADGYPLTGTGIPVHNVPLSHAAEIGVIGAACWLLALALSAGAALLRTGPESLDPWRLGYFALFLHWVIVASFGPLGYAFPNLLLWTWAGIAAIGHISRPLTPEEKAEREPALIGAP